MSGAAMKWAMPEKGTPPKFTDMHPEKKWFLACLAWEANRFDNRICSEEGRDITTLAIEAGVSVRAARRYVKAFVAEGILQAVGRTGYHNRVTIFLLTLQRSCVAAKAPAKRAGVSTIQGRSNGASNSTIQGARYAQEATLNGASNDTRNVSVVALNGASGSIVPPPSIYGLQELLQEEHNAHWRAPSPVSQAKPRPDDDARNVTGSAAQKAIAAAMITVFFGECEANVRDEVESGCVHFAREGLNSDDMGWAICKAKQQEKKLDRKPRWTSVRSVLDGVLRTRTSVLGVAQTTRHTQETIDGAHALEAIFSRHIEKPAWTATRARCDLADWLCRCVALHRVDGAMFEAACRAAKQQANGTLATWRTVRDALATQIEARKHAVIPPG
ncbi:hypothetical protein [Paraburkholderia youngii]|uniref:Uncharacterized protein n=1 Tax=Paraburkholderia youngii TaxID=2782701 RepID=A0A7Y6K1B4_9BURK|nr:hypothetical protein [Paraburkholderia youngii]NUY01703.1 hypothetical protein [Paraburkholderia youngii]